MSKAKVTRLSDAKVRRLTRACHRFTDLLGKPLPDNPAERTLFLLHRARHRMVRQVYPDIFRALETAPRRSPLQRRCLEMVGRLVADLGFTSRFVGHVDHVLREGIDGRKYADKLVAGAIPTIRAGKGAGR